MKTTLVILSLLSVALSGCATHECHKSEAKMGCCQSKDKKCAMHGGDMEKSKKKSAM